MHCTATIVDVTPSGNPGDCGLCTALRLLLTYP